jgi:hypothetical protein
VPSDPFAIFQRHRNLLCEFLALLSQMRDQLIQTVGIQFGATNALIVLPKFDRQHGLRRFIDVSLNIE